MNTEEHELPPTIMCFGNLLDNDFSTKIEVHIQTLVQTSLYCKLKHFTWIALQPVVQMWRLRLVSWYPGNLKLYISEVHPAEMFVLLSSLLVTIHTICDLYFLTLEVKLFFSHKTVSATLILGGMLLGLASKAPFKIFFLPPLSAKP